MNAYLQPLKALFEPQADAEKADSMSKYMRNQFPFLGIRFPQQKVLFKQFVAKYGVPDLSQIEPIARELWSWPQREYQYVALSLLDEPQKHLTSQCLPLLEYLIVTKSWWDTVDPLASHHVGKILLQHPEARDPVITLWRRSEHLWLRRTTLLFQLSYKVETDESLLFELIQENKASKEFFIQKAIGWSLREYSKTSPDAVKAFVEASALAPLSQREALKWMRAKGLI